MFSSGLANLGKWWLDELAGMLAPSFAAARPSRRIVLVPGAGGITGMLEERGNARPFDGWPTGEVAPAGELAALLASLPSWQRQLPVVIRVPAQSVHTRTVVLPAAARNNLEQLLALDLVRTTPLKPAELYQGYRVAGPAPAPGMLFVRHYLVKRRAITPLIEQVAAAAMKVDGIECLDDTEPGAPPSTLLPVGETAATRPTLRLEMALAALAIGLGIFAAASHWLRKEQSASATAALVAEMESRAAVARRTLEQATGAGLEIDRLREIYQSRPPALYVLDETARLIPDDAWVEEFRLDGDQIEIAGLAREGTRLLSAFETSPLFRDTQFTAPLRFEPAEGKERFRMRTRLRARVTETTKPTGSTR